MVRLLLEILVRLSIIALFVVGIILLRVDVTNGLLAFILATLMEHNINSKAS